MADGKPLLELLILLCMFFQKKGKKDNTHVSLTFSLFLSLSFSLSLSLFLSLSLSILISAIVKDYQSKGLKDPLLREMASGKEAPQQVFRWVEKAGSGSWVGVNLPASVPATISAFKLRYVFSKKKKEEEEREALLCCIFFVQF